MDTEKSKDSVRLSESIDCLSARYSTPKVIDEEYTLAKTFQSFVSEL